MTDITHILGLSMESRLGSLSSTQLSFIANSPTFPEGSRREAASALQGRFDAPAVPITTLDPAEAEGVQQFFTGIDTLGGASAAPAIDPGAVFPGGTGGQGQPVISPVDAPGGPLPGPPAPGFFDTAFSNVVKSLAPRGPQQGSPFDPISAEIPGPAPASASDPENAAARAALEGLRPKGGAGVAPPTPTTAAPIPQTPPVSAAGKAAAGEVPTIGTSEDFGKIAGELDTKVKSIIDAFSDSEAVADIDEQGIKQSGVLGGAARAAFIALQNPRSGFAQLGIGGIILAAGLGSVQGLAKAEDSIRAENKEARREKAQFGANKAELMLNLQKVVTALAQTGLTNETRIGIANLNALVAKLEADNVASRHADTLAQRAVANGLAALRAQIASLSEQRQAQQGERRLGLAEGAATKEQTGAPPIEGGDTVDVFARELAGMIVSGNIPEQVPPDLIESATKTARERIAELGPQTGKQGAEQFNTQFNIALVELLRNAPQLLQAVFAGQ